MQYVYIQCYFEFLNFLNWIDDICVCMYIYVYIYPYISLYNIKVHEQCVAFAKK